MRSDPEMNLHTILPKCVFTLHLIPVLTYLDALQKETLPAERVFTSMYLPGPINLHWERADLGTMHDIMFSSCQKCAAKKIHWNMRGLPHTQEKRTWVVHHSPLRCLPIPATPRCFSAPTLYKATTTRERERERGETPHCTIWTPSIGKFMSMEALLAALLSF